MTNPHTHVSADIAQADLERLYRITWTLHGGLPFTRFCELRRALIPDAAQSVEVTPIAWTNKMQLSFLKDPAYAEIPMAMWGKCGDYADIPLYAAQPPAAPVETDQIGEAMALLGDVPGETLVERVNKLISYHLGLQAELEKRSAHNGSSAATASVRNDAQAKADFWASQAEKQPERRDHFEIISIQFQKIADALTLIEPQSLPVKLTGEIACILEDCSPPDKQTPEALAALIEGYQPTWDRIRSALSRPLLLRDEGDKA